MLSRRLLVLCQCVRVSIFSFFLSFFLCVCVCACVCHSARPHTYAIRTCIKPHLHTHTPYAAEWCVAPASSTVGLSGDRMLPRRVSRGKRAISPSTVSSTEVEIAPRCAMAALYGATSAGAGRTAESIRKNQPQTRAERQTTSMSRQPGSMS